MRLLQQIVLCGAVTFRNFHMKPNRALNLDRYAVLSHFPFFYTVFKLLKCGMQAWLAPH